MYNTSNPPLRNFIKNVYLWYKLTNLYYIDIINTLSNYPQTGMLSSHFVHFLSKKNIVYQTKSKYRSKIINMNSVYSYLYMYANILYLYLQLLNWNLYFFTANVSKQTLTTNSEFNTLRSN
jgi:hypothetical protein